MRKEKDINNKGHSRKEIKKFQTKLIVQKFIQGKLNLCNSDVRDKKKRYQKMLMYSTLEGK